MKKPILVLLIVALSISSFAAEIDPVMSFGETRTFTTYLTAHPIGYTSYDYSTRDIPSFVTFNERGVISRSGTWPLYFPRFYAEYDLVIEDGAEVGTYTFYLDYELSLYGSSPIDKTITIHLTIEDSDQDHDFSIATLEVSPSPQHAGNEIEVSFSHLYGGTAAANQTSYFQFYLSANTSFEPGTDIALSDGSFFSAVSTRTPSSSEQIDVTIPQSAAVGTYYILAVTDYENNVAETDETNNMASVPISIVEPMYNDLYIENLAADPSSIQAGGSTVISFNQTYAGNSVNFLGINSKIHLSTNTTWGDADDVSLGNDVYARVDVNNSSVPVSSSVSIPLITTPGTYYIMVMSDYEDNVAETDETNNVSSIQITVLDAAYHDFLVENLAADPSSIVSGGRTRITFDQVYGGNSVSTVGPRYRIHLSSNTEWGDVDDISLSYDVYSSLNAENTSDPVSRYITIPETAAKGSWYILVMADYNEQFEETDETNNVEYISVQIDCEEITSEEAVSICEGESYNSWTESGTYYRTFSTLEGCDSIVTTLLTVYPVYNITEDITVCDGASYNGWTTSGQYTRTLTSTYGCDSIVTTNLTAGTTVEYTEYIEICEGESYNNWSESGEYSRTLTSQVGCDSIVTTMLTVLPAYDITESISICEGERYKGWSESGEYSQNIKTLLGCDSIVTTILTVNPIFNITEDVSICEGASYHGWTTSGQYTRNLISSSACDSIVITNLSVGGVIEVTEYIDICEGESYNSWSESGEYSRILNSNFGCDSVVTTMLSVRPVYDLVENISILSGTDYNGWTESGTYVRTLNTVSGCDSIVTTNLEIIEEADILKADFFVESWYGEAPFEVSFSNSSSGNFTSIEWNFGDGNTSHNMDPAHLYTKPGCYTVSLTISNKSGTDQVIKTNFIQVYSLHTEDTISVDIVPGDSVQLIIQHQPPFNPTSIIKQTNFGTLYDPVIVKLDSLALNPGSDAIWAYYKLLLEQEAELENEYFKQFLLHYFRGQLAVTYTHNYKITAVENMTNTPIDPEYQPGFTLFPNPAHNQFYIELLDERAESSTIVIYNSIGKIVFNEKLSGYPGDIVNIISDQWTRGIYYVGIISGENKEFQKLVLW